MNNEEKIEAAGKKKEEGNALFKAGKYARASKRYEKVNISRRMMMCFHPKYDVRFQFLRCLT